MPYLERPGARLFYDVQGDGPLIITIHGYIENGGYWGRPGVSARLAAAGFRVADMDMRGHGRSVAADGPAGFDVDTVADDIGALADVLGQERFHLLTHATGGMAGLRFAQARSSRLLSLVSTSTSSATIPIDDYCGPEWDEAPFPALDIPGGRIMAEGLSDYGSFGNTLRTLKESPEGHLLAPFFRGFEMNAHAARCWQWIEDIYETNVFSSCLRFAESFFSSADPHTERLRGVTCPSLVIVGELDSLLLKPTEQINRCIPGSRRMVLDGVGHMLSIEAPDRLLQAILPFVRQT